MLFCFTYFLCDRKYQRTRHSGKIFASTLCSRRQKASPRSGTCSPLQAFDCFQGVAELVLCGYIRKFIPAQNFGQSSHNGLKTVGPPLDFSTVPFRLRRRITFVHSIASVIPKTKPAPLKDTSKVLLVFGNSGRTV